MATHHVLLRLPFGNLENPTVLSDTSAYLSDASYLPNGFALGVVRPHSESGVAQVLLTHSSVLPIGAQSSVTGGATPFGEVILSMQHFSEMTLENDTVCVGAGVSLRVLQDFLDTHGYWLAGIPTYDGAQVGGALSTNAAGATTFKYGSIRNQTIGLTVVLASGDVLDIQRGQYQAHIDGYFEFSNLERTWRVPVPSYTMPAVEKSSAGYFSAPQMDLIDLFIGAEGTLGIIVAAKFRVISPRPRVAMALIPCPNELAALKFTAALRLLAFERRAGRRGLDVSAIEYMDGRCVELLHQDGSDQRLGFYLEPSTCQALLLVQIELPKSSQETDLADFFSLLEQHQLENTCLYAAPEDHKAAKAMIALREAVPEGINARFARAKREVDPRITKVGADMVVPFAQLGKAMQAYRQVFDATGIDYAIWGHASDGNMHPNMLPRHFEDVEIAKQAVLKLGEIIIQLGGCPMAEHGVGRNQTKQALLLQLYGEAGIRQMQNVKKSLDPNWILSPNVLVSFYF